MNVKDWMRLPWRLKLFTLLVGVFFGQRFDRIGHNEVDHEVYVIGTPRNPRLVRRNKGT